jgi:hypothetical protein
MKPLFFSILFFFVSLSIHAQHSSTENSNSEIVKKLSGPRIGFTFLTSGSSADFINDFNSNSNDNSEHKSAFITQYGYQWETRFADNDEGIVGLVEWVFLIGGLEKGFFLPSASSLFGIRSANGFEFAVGPNLSITGVGYLLAIGKNFKSGNLNFPINIAFVPSKKNTWGDVDPTGHRISLTLGFNISK